MNPVTQPLAMFIFKVNESLLLSALRICFLKECPPALLNIGLACHTRTPQTGCSPKSRPFMRTYENSSNVCLHKRKKNSDCGKCKSEQVLNMLSEMKDTDDQPCLFAPLKFSTVSPFHLLSAPQSDEMATFARTWCYERKENKMLMLKSSFKQHTLTELTMR